MKRFGRFSSESVAEKVEIKVEETQNNKEILDADLIQYIITEFPDVAEDIRDSLISLRNTLEKSIDFIEDKSSDIIKESRDFQLSGKYRDTNIKLHNISKNITDYSLWMNNELGTIENVDTTLNQCANSEDAIEEKGEVETNTEELINEEDKEELTYIYDDFTAKNPKAFKLDNHNITVEGWDDMIVKTADILTKHYKQNKNCRILSGSANPKPVHKKSKQNELRDTIIEMLQEYKVNLKNYEVEVREIN